MLSRSLSFSLSLSHSLSLSLIVTAVSVAAAAAATAVASAVDIAVNFDSAPELSPYSTVETSPSSTAVAAAAVTVAHCSLITAHTLTLLHLSPILISSSLCLFVFLQSIHFFSRLFSSLSTFKYSFDGRRFFTCSYPL